MDGLLQDLRYGIRLLLRTPGFTVVAIATLALGIGANTAIFSVVNAVLLRPLPYPHPDRLVQVWEASPRINSREGTVSPYNLADWAEQSQTFERLAAYAYASYELTGDEQPQAVTASPVSVELLATIGINPALGRDFLSGEDALGANHVVILSHGLWERRYGSDPALLGKSITLNGESYTVVGVMPLDFKFPASSVEMWVPLTIDPQHVTRGSHYLFAVGRLKPGVSLRAAQSEMDQIAASLEQQYPDTNKGFGVNLVGLHEQLVGQARLALAVLSAAVGFVLLIACANVANLLLARAASRQKEIAIRTALGAGRTRLVRQFLTESTLLAIAGGGLGLVLSLWSVRLFLAAAGGGIPRSREVSIDGRVLAFTIAVALLTGLVFGLAPALHATRADLNAGLKEGGRDSASGFRGQRLRSLLVISEVALALVLLIGAGLLMNSFMRLRRVDPGFNPNSLLTLQINLPKARYKDGPQQSAFFQQALARITTIEGVQSAGAITDLPFSGSRTASSFEIQDRPQADPNSPQNTDRRTVSPAYFQALGIPLLKGRDFTDYDVKENTPVTIINASMAKRYWPDEEPIGKRLSTGGSEERAFYGGKVWREIVGIVGDIKHDKLDAQGSPEMYMPYFQRPDPRMSIVVRSASDFKPLIAAIRGAVESIDPSQPIYNIRPMADRLADSISPQRLDTMMLGAFSTIALLLAAIGIYGVVSYSVAQRIHEVGIRMALGASPAAVLGLVLRQGMGLAMVGVICGLAGSIAATRAISSLLFGVSATDPATFALISIVLLAIALLACYVPARRAAKVEPMEALRCQ